MYPFNLKTEWYLHVCAAWKIHQACCQGLLRRNVPTCRIVNGTLNIRSSFKRWWMNECRNGLKLWYSESMLLIIKRLIWLTTPCDGTFIFFFIIIFSFLFFFLNKNWKNRVYVRSRARMCRTETRRENRTVRSVKVFQNSKSRPIWWLVFTTRPRRMTCGGDWLWKCDCSICAKYLFQLRWNVPWWLDGRRVVNDTKGERQNDNFWKDFKLSFMIGVKERRIANEKVCHFGWQSSIAMISYKNNWKPVTEDMIGWQKNKK